MSGECDIGGTLPGASEIDRLSKLWIKAHDRIVQQDAEIERLKLELHNEKQYAADLITTLRCEAEDKDAEIERLKANIIWLEARNKALTEMRLEDKALITELCLGIDAVQLDTCTPRDWEMLNEAAGRAREATR